jgi:hypothetical protein
MSEYKEITESIDVPTHSGLEGFFVALRKILKMPRVTNVNIDARGKVSYTRFARAEEPRKTIDIDFDAVSPGALVRNIELQELDVPMASGAAVAIAALFSAASSDHLYPIGFVTGANTVLPDWHLKSTGVKIPVDSLYGFPLYKDRFIPDETLLLVTGYSLETSLPDAQKSYKIAMPGRQAPVLPVPELIVSYVSSNTNSLPEVAAAVPSPEQVKDEVEIIP